MELAIVLWNNDNWCWTGIFQQHIGDAVAQSAKRRRPEVSRASGLRLSIPEWSGIPRLSCWLRNTGASGRWRWWEAASDRCIGSGGCPGVGGVGGENKDEWLTGRVTRGQPLIMIDRWGQDQRVSPPRGQRSTWLVSRKNILLTTYLESNLSWSGLPPPDDSDSDSDNDSWQSVINFERQVYRSSSKLRCFCF